MKKSLLTKTLLSLAALVAINACSESNETKYVSVPFKMTASGTAPTVAKLTPFQKILDFILPSSYAFMPTSMVDSTGLVVSLTEAWVMVESVEFEALEFADAAELAEEEAEEDELVENETDEDDDAEFSGPYAVDLLSATPSVLDTQLIPQIPFKRIEMKLHAADAAVSGAPAGLLNNSIYIAGSIGANTFSYQSDEETEIEINGPNAVVPVDGQGIVVEIKLANLFKQIDLSGVPNAAAISATSRYAGVNLCPAIDASAADVYTCIRKGLEQEADCGSDSDDDGDLDEDDDTVNDEDDSTDDDDDTVVE